MSSRKRLPGESNDEYAGRKNPNGEFIGTKSLFGGGDLSFVHRALTGFYAWRDRRRKGAR